MTDFTKTSQSTSGLSPDDSSFNPYETKTTEVKPSSDYQQNSYAKRLLKLLFSFQGRAHRGHYWAVKMSTLLGVMLLGLLTTGLLELWSPDNLSDGDSIALLLFTIVAGVLVVLCFLALIWINIAVTVKRFHDRGKPGAMILIALIPYIGSFWIFIECGILPGTVGPNSYGDDPTKLPFL